MGAPRGARGGPGALGRNILDPLDSLDRPCPSFYFLGPFREASGNPAMAQIHIKQIVFNDFTSGQCPKMDPPKPPLDFARPPRAPPRPQKFLRARPRGLPRGPRATHGLPISARAPPNSGQPSQINFCYTSLLILTIFPKSSSNPRGKQYFFFDFWT